MIQYSDTPCPKCKKKNVRAVFTTDIDYVTCTTCSFVLELSEWNKLADNKPTKVKAK